MTEWVLHEAFHLLFLCVNLGGLAVSTWAWRCYERDRDDREESGENGGLAYSTTVNLRREVAIWIVQACGVAIGAIRLSAASFSALPEPAATAASWIVVLTGAQSTVLLWSSVYGRYGRGKLLQMLLHKAMIGGRRRDD